MTETKGIQETKELLGLVLASVDVYVEAKKDGKLGLEDIGLLLKLLPSVGVAFDKIGEVPKEVTDLSEAEIAELAAMILANHGVSDSAKVKALIGGGLKVAAGVVQIVGGLKA